MPLKQCRIVGCESFHRLPKSFHLVLAVFGEIFNARKKHYRGCILDNQSASIHPGRAAVANHAGHSGIAAVVHGRIQTAFVNQPLLVGVLPNVAGFDTLWSELFLVRCQLDECCQVRICGANSPAGAPVHPGTHAPLRRLLQRESDIHRLTFRRSEPLDDDVVGPGSESLTKPVAVFVSPDDLYLAVLEIDSAQIVPDRRGFRKIELHQECRDGEVRLGILLDRAFIHVLKSESNGFAVFPIQRHLPHLRKNVRDVGCLQGSLPGHEQAFVVEKDLLRVGIAHQLDIHRTIAGGETLANQVPGGDAAKAPLRHNLPPDPFHQRHRWNRIRSPGCRWLGQEWDPLHAVKIFSRTIVRQRRSCFWGFLFSRSE